MTCLVYNTHVQLGKTDINFHAHPRYWLVTNNTGKLTNHEPPRMMKCGIVYYVVVEVACTFESLNRNFEDVACIYVEEVERYGSVVEHCINHYEATS